MILYRKAQQLRVRRSPAPEPPFWAATTISPYSARRTTPVAIDFGTLRASGAERLEVTVCENVRDELDRTRGIHAPVLIEATGNAEMVFRRGAEAMEWCAAHQLDAQLLTSGGPAARIDGGDGWGVAVPVIFPVTTDLALLETLAEQARRDGASFFAAVGIEVDPTAKQALARQMNLGGEDERYAMLFHTDTTGIQIATERHIAALAAERGLADFIVPPRWSDRSNWNAAVLLTLTASRMMAMELDLDLAGALSRSARTIAELAKPLTRIAESASLSIIGGIDEVAVEMLTEFLATGSAAFREYVDEQWRTRRA